MQMTERKKKNMGHSSYSGAGSLYGAAVLVCRPAYDPICIGTGKIPSVGGWPWNLGQIGLYWYGNLPDYHSHYSGGTIGNWSRVCFWRNRGNHPLPDRRCAGRRNRGAFGAPLWSKTGRSLFPAGKDYVAALYAGQPPFKTAGFYRFYDSGNTERSLVLYGGTNESKNEGLALDLFDSKNSKHYHFYHRRKCAGGEKLCLCSGSICGNAAH